MKDLIAAGEKVMHKDATPEALDAALICGAQKIEHYEISGYGTATHVADSGRTAPPNATGRAKYRYQTERFG